MGGEGCEGRGEMGVRGDMCIGRCMHMCMMCVCKNEQWNFRY